MTTRSPFFAARRSRFGSGARLTRGFTLLELMITVAIIAVLASIAYATYQNNVVESRRKAAAACLLEAAQFMERRYTTVLSYAGATLPGLTCQTDLARFYTIAISGTPTATLYSLTATPVSGSQQANRDTKCATLGINQSGTKSETGTGSVADCW